MNKKTFLIVLSSLVFHLLNAQQCVQPVRFTWEGAVNGNRAIWKADDISNTYTGIGGMDVKVSILDPLGKNTTTSNPSDYGDYTKTNTFYGRGNLALQITSTQSNQPVCVEFSFSKAIFMHKFEVFDIDYIGSGSNPYSSYQDSVSFYASNDSGVVALQLMPLSAIPAFAMKGQNVSANFVQGINGDLLHTDSLGAVRVSSSLPITKFTLCYANGSKDKDGLSDSQAIKIMPFEFCEALGRISGRITEFITDAPLSGSLLKLMDSDGNPFKDDKGNDYEYTTGADGFYQFVNLPFGKYIVLQQNPAGYDSENDIDGVNDNRIETSVHVMAPFSDGNDFYEKLASPLPVRFGSMRLKRTSDATVNVIWNTLGEQNSDFFEIAVSNDGTSFMPVMKVKAEGNSVKEIFYTQSISANTTENVFVRLEQFDLDGKKHHLDMQYLKSQRNTLNEFRLYPNPVSDFLNIETNGEIHYEILDAKGNDIIKGITKNNITSIQIGHLMPGMYLARLYNEEFVNTRRFMVVK